MIKHIPHVDDYAFTNLMQGVDVMSAVVDRLRGYDVNYLSVSTKFDGAPAVVFGTNPENGKFFVGTKSVFNKKVPKIIYDVDSLLLHYGDNVELRDKMWMIHTVLKVAYEEGHIPKEGVFQGDFMYMQDSVVHSGKMAHFTPNTITYGIHLDSPLRDRFTQAEIGIALHTAYVGDTIQGLKPYGKIDWDAFVNQFVMWFDTRVELSEDLLTLTQLDIIGRFVEIAEKYQQANITLSGKHPEMLMKFINHSIRIGEDAPNIDMYHHFLKCKGVPEMIETSDYAIDALSVRHILSYCSNIIIRALDTDRSIYHEYKGQPCAPEGYVINYHGVLTKFVNRMEFSRRNFLNKRFENA